MFSLIESKIDIAKAQQKLENCFRRDFRKRATKNIGYPSGTEREAKVFTNGNYWYWSSDYRAATIPRRLNWFGVFREDKDLEITVEINTPFQGGGQRIGGFFARDNATGGIYLFHSGRVGGGTKGISRSAFLSWSGHKLLDVFDASGRVRQGIPVMPLEGPATTRPGIRYVETIVDFKKAVRAGETKTSKSKQQERQLIAFYQEGRGRRSGKRAADFDYISRHGEVVDALHAWRQAAGLAKGSKLVKNVLIDLGVSGAGPLTEIYEVKTGASRSHVYTAIGQLLVHGESSDCKRAVVLPRSEILSDDLARALKRNAIEVIRYRLTKDAAIIG